MKRGLIPPHESEIRHRVRCWSLEMGVVLRYLVSRMMVFFRLAVVVSLAGYTIPNANAAMHGSAYSEVVAAVAPDDQADTHRHTTAVEHADAGLHADVGHHADAGHHGDDGDLGKQVKKDCCQDFCFSIALPSSCESSVPPVRVSLVFTTFDDSRVHGTRPSLHRPPNI